MKTFGELTAADLGMPFKHGAVEGTLVSLRHFRDHKQQLRTIAFVKVPVPNPRKPDHREVQANSSEPIGGAA